MNPLGEFLRQKNAATRAAVLEDLDGKPEWPRWIADTCDAVDKLIDLHAAGVDPCLDTREGGCETLRLLAFPYRAHPKYRTTWRPLDRPSEDKPTADYGAGVS